MKKQVLISIVLLILLTTITSQEKIIISKFNLKEINIENNFLLKEKEINEILTPFYGKNLIFLKNNEIQKALMQSSLIESFVTKKKYPDTLIIKIFEKKPLAILINKNTKYYLSEKIDLIEFKNFKEYQDLPYIFGNRKKFKIFYENLIKINFPLNSINKYTLFKADRWDIETKDKKLIKLPIKDYTKSLKNYLELINKNDFKKYEVFDYRIQNQLILK